MNAPPKDPAPVFGRLRVPLLNFVHYHAFGFAIPYFTLYLSRILVFEDGRTANHLVGLFLLVFNGLVLLSTPIAGYAADRFGIGHRVLAICAVGVAIGTALVAVPGFLAPVPLELSIAIALPGVVVAGFCLHPIVPLIDSQTLLYLHRTRGQGLDYGRIRMLGSIGFTVSTLLIAVVLSRTHQVAWTFALSSIGFLSLAVVAGAGVHVVPSPVPIPWRHLKYNRRFQRFLFFAFFASLSVNSAFLFTSYFLEEIGTGFIVMGLTFAISVLPEIPVMFKSGVLIRRVGVPRVILMGVAAQVVKLALFVGFASSSTMWVFAVVSVFHGLGFGLLYTGCVNFVDTASHPDMRATYQNLFRLLWVAAIAVGGPISGFVIDLWSTTALMATYAVMLVATGAYFAVFVVRALAAETRSSSGSISRRAF